MERFEATLAAFDAKLSKIKLSVCGLERILSDFERVGAIFGQNFYLRGSKILKFRFFL